MFINYTQIKICIITILVKQEIKSCFNTDSEKLIKKLAYLILKKKIIYYKIS